MSWIVPGYVVEELVGVGASGEVWRGRSAGSDEVVAFKRLPVQDEPARRRAAAEAAVLSALDHPHILRLRELLISEGEAILVTDYAAGGSLAQVLEHRGRLSPGEVVTVVAPIAAALAHAHAEGIVHGDVSAANILFTDRGLPLLADLGVARIVGQVGTAARATPEYVDPLVVRGAHPGPHSDVFALAAVAWHALTGSAPWAGESAAESLAHAADGGLPTLRSVAPHVPDALAAALDRALQDNGLLRGSAAELALDTRHAVAPIPVDGWTARAEQPTGPPSTAARPGRHHAPEPAMDLSGGRPPFRRVEPPPLVSPSARTRVARRDPLLDPLREPRADNSAVLAPAGARRRWATLLLAAAAVLASVTAGGWWAERAPGQANPATSPLARTSAAAAPDATASSAPSASSGPSAPSAPPASASASAVPGPASTEPDWLAELARIDAAREQAYATGDPAPLGDVYASPALLERDRAQLSAQVPPGCRLEGAGTRYSALTVQSADPHRAVLAVTAELAPARLTCAGAVKATTTAVGPVRLAISVTLGDDGRWRIEDQRMTA